MAAQAANRDDVQPAETERPAAVPFTVGYNRKGGEGTVFGSLSIGVIFLAAAAATGLPLLAVAGLGPIAFAYRHYPLLEKGRPQLGANTDGLFIDRIGFIDWKAIRMAEISRTNERGREQVRLNVLLTRPVPDAVAKSQNIPFWKRFMMRNWVRSPREHGRELIAIDLNALSADPDEVLSRIRSFKFV